MADFERKMSLLADRGHHVGPEGMIERVEAALAADPLVVAIYGRKGRTMGVKTTEEEKAPTGPTGIKAGMAWAVAAFVLVLAVGGFMFTRSDEGAPATSEEEVVSTMLDSAIAHEELSAFFLPAQEPGWVDWLYGLGYEGRYDCEPAIAETTLVECTVESDNELARMAGIDSNTVRVGFTVGGGVITAQADEGWMIPDGFPRLIEIYAQWISTNHPDRFADEFASNCTFGRDIDCVEFGELTWTATFENGQTMLELAPEFFEGSRTYPVGG